MYPIISFSLDISAIRTKNFLKKIDVGSLGRRDHPMFYHITSPINQSSKRKAHSCISIKYASQRNVPLPISNLRIYWSGTQLIKNITVLWGGNLVHVHYISSDGGFISVLYNNIFQGIVLWWTDGPSNMVVQSLQMIFLAQLAYILVFYHESSIQT